VSRGAWTGAVGRTAPAFDIGVRLESARTVIALSYHIRCMSCKSAAAREGGADGGGSTYFPLSRISPAW